MRILIFVLLFFSQFPSFSQKNVIPWTEDLDSTFSWDLFSKGTVPGGFHALTTVEFIFKSDVIEDNQVVAKLEVLMDTRKSLYAKNIYKKSLPPQSLLDHEKLHFDIAEYSKRLFFQKISSIKGKNVNDIIKKIEKEFQLSTKLVVSLQKKYDKETNHSQNNIKQKMWEEDIKQKLIELRDFSTNEMTLSVVN